MDEQIIELERLASDARAKKSRMDAESRAKAAELIASIWTDPALDPRSTLQFLEDLQSEAIADGVATSWMTMTAERRLLFQRWVPLPTSDRAYRRLALLLGAIIGNDGDTALRWLSLLIPKDRKTINKESRQLLASVLFGDKQVRFEAIAYEGARSSEVLRIYSALLDIATDHSLSVGAVTRARLASAILAYISRAEAGSDVSDFHSRISTDMKKWPAALREQFERQTGTASTPTPEPETHEPAVAPISEREVSLPRVPSLSELSSLPERFRRIELQISDRLTGLMRELEVLHSLQPLLTGWRDSCIQLQRDLDGTKQELETVEGRLRDATDDGDAVRKELQRVTERISVLTAALDAAKADADAERRRLAQQIAANAAGRVEEFRNRLGSTLARLVVDLPETDVSVSAELGRVLLLQFHQFLDALGQEGVETRPGVRSK